MADYNPNYMATTRRGRNLDADLGIGAIKTGKTYKGSDSAVTGGFNYLGNDDDKPTGLGAKPKTTTTTTKDDGPSFWERITQAFTNNEVDVTNVYQPSVDPSQLYNQDIFKIAPVASDYVYRAEMSEQTQDMVEQAMGYELPMTSLAEQMGVIDINTYDPNTGANALNLSQILKLPDEIQDNIFREMHEGKDSLLGTSSVNALRLVDTSYMSEEEKKQFAPLIKLADDIRNENITTSELPTVLSNNQIKDLASKAIAAGTFSRGNVEDDIFYQNLLSAITKGNNPLLDIEGNVVQGEPYTLDEEASLMDALMEGQPTGLMSRPSSFTGGSVDVASNMPDWMAELSAAEMVDAIQGINEGTVDPETGQPIQTAEDVPAPTGRQRRRELVLPDIPTNIDLGFLGKQEGKGKTQGYVPRASDNTALESSGVTIGTGVDLGSKDDFYFEGLDQDLKDKISPYFGKKKQAAIDALEATPLTLTAAEVATLDEYVKKREFRTLKNRWNKDSDTDWDDLTSGKATAVASVYYQYGPKMFKHNYWKQTTSGDWQAAYNNLMNYGDKYTSRRRREAAILKKDM